MDLFKPNDMSRFANFSIQTYTYRTVANHSITSNVLIPSHMLNRPHAETGGTNTTRKAPLILRFHGGGLIAASSLFPDFFAPWHLQLAERHSAIIVSPNYRLIPESTVSDTLSDIDHFWTWVLNEMPQLVAQSTNDRVQPDTSRIMTAGDSAGGLLGIMLGLKHRDEIRVVTAACPMIDLKSRHFTEAYDKPMFGLAQLPKSMVDEHIYKVKSGQLPSIVSEGVDPARLPLMFAIPQNGLFKDYFPKDQRQLFPIDLVEDGARLPPGGTFIWHGREDKVVPAEGSVKFKDMVNRRSPENKIVLELQEGDHGFDGAANIDDAWLASIIQDLLPAWLK